MSKTYRYATATGLIVAAGIAVAGGLLASGSGDAVAQPLTADPSTVSPVKSAQPSSSSPIASLIGVSGSRTSAGLEAAKRAGGATEAGVSAFTKVARVSPAAARQAVADAFGTLSDDSLTGTAAARQLAARLGITPSAAQHAMSEIGALSGKNGVDPHAAPYAEIARRLGVSPSQLGSGLDDVKRRSAG